MKQRQVVAVLGTVVAGLAVAIAALVVVLGRPTAPADNLSTSVMGSAPALASRVPGTAGSATPTPASTPSGGAPTSRAPAAAATAGSRTSTGPKPAGDLAVTAGDHCVMRVDSSHKLWLWVYVNTTWTGNGAYPANTVKFSIPSFAGGSFSGEVKSTTAEVVSIELGGAAAPTEITAGWTAFSITVDAAKTVAETNEANNTLAMQAQLPGITPPPGNPATVACRAAP